MKPIYGLIGNPVAHSMSPDIHNAALKDLSLDGYYHAFRVETDDLEDAVKVLWKQNIYAESGMGCTGPIIRVSDANLAKAEEELKKAGYIN